MELGSRLTAGKLGDLPDSLAALNSGGFLDGRVGRVVKCSIVPPLPQPLLVGRPAPLEGI